MSLTLQERFIVTQFNSTQLKCYIFLKIVNKEIILKYAPESLSSYHIKTCMFYMVENTPEEFWRPANLLCAIEFCLGMMSLWAETGICPNYFIPAENMFERICNGEVRRRRNQILQQLLSTDCKYLLSIRTESLGERLRISLLPRSVRVDLQQNHILSSDFEKKRVCHCIQALQKCFECCHDCLLNRCNRYRPNIEVFLTSLYGYIRKLQGTKTITEHTCEETQLVTSVMVPYLELSLLSNLIAFKVIKGNSKGQIWAYLASNKWHEVSVNSDSFSFKLKQASLLSVLGYYDVALDVLSQLTTLARFTACICNENMPIHPDIETVLEVFPERIYDISSLLNTAIVPCIYYLPFEKSVTPTAIQYEMMKIDDTRPLLEGNMDNVDAYRREWAFIDGQFLLYFLLYLNHSKLNMESQASADIASMEWILNTRNISHRSTCLNLLGWVFSEQGCVNRAVQCFELSLNIKSHPNAAYQHIKDLSNTEV